MFLNPSRWDDRGMTEGRLTDEPGRAPDLGGRAALVLADLRSAERPEGAAAVAERTGLPLNTARFHLDRLVGRGLAERVTERRATRGRPRVLYAARAAASGPRSYRLLARMLGGIVAELDEVGSTGADAGRAWGRHLVERTPPTGRVTAAEAVQRLTALMDEVGFVPEVDAGDPRRCSILLHHCPFLEIAEEQPAVVCGLHLGLMQGALEELRAPVEVEELRPLVEPTLCVARLGPTTAESPGR
jgi:predicted ArsR family transcriptional regulator